MGGLRRCHTHHCHRVLLTTATAAAALALLIFASAIEAYNPTRQLSKSGRSPSKPNSEAAQSSWATLISSRVRRGGERELVEEEAGEVVARRRLTGPGSAPPTCRSKCGRCSPCKAVHVPIQPGWSMPLEYYPEAWRCKCGNKLYMP